jgi:hypothetical protein
VLPPLQQLTLGGDGALQFLTSTHLPALTKLACLTFPVDAAAGQMLQGRAELLRLCNWVWLKGSAGSVTTDDDLKAVTDVLVNNWQQVPTCGGGRKLAISDLYCPQTVLSNMPKGITILTLE